MLARTSVALVLTLPVAHGLTLPAKFASASAAVRTACASFGPQHERVATRWLHDLEGAAASPAPLPLDANSLWSESVAVLDQCSTLDDDSLCTDLESALVELSKECAARTERGFGETEAHLPLWCRGTAKGTFQSVLPPTLQQQNSASSGVQKAVDKVRKAAAAMGQEQAAAVMEWLADADAWVDASSLHARRVPLFAECALGSSLRDSRCKVLQNALSDLQVLVDEARAESPMQRAT